MSNEEAIAYGKECLSWNQFSKDMKMYQFIEMAIKALSQEPTDAISRDAVLNLCTNDKYNIPFEYKDDKGIHRGYDEYRLINYYKLKQLPSVTPKSGKWIDYRDDGFVECPFCGHATNCEDDIDELHYCFYCGAKLVEPQERSDKENGVRPL